MPVWVQKSKRTSCVLIIQPACDVPGTPPEGPLKVLTSEASRGPSDDQQKIDELTRKVFLDAIVFALHIYYCFSLAKQIFKSSKSSTGTSYGTSRGPNDGTLWGRPRDVGHICFLNSLLWQVTQDFKVK